MPTILRPRSIGRVITAHNASSIDPLEVTEGQTVEVGRGSTDWPGFLWCTNPQGQGGWVPEAYLDHSKGPGVMRCDYSSAELSVSPGEQLVLHKLESGWYWASNNEGKSGWVPADNIELAEDE